MLSDLIVLPALSERRTNNTSDERRDLQWSSSRAVHVDVLFAKKKCSVCVCSKCCGVFSTVTPAIEDGSEGFPSVSFPFFFVFLIFSMFSLFKLCLIIFPFFSS